MLTSLDEFKEVLGEINGVTKTALAGISALPIITMAIDLSPPWPRGMPVVTCLIELIVLMLSFHYARRFKKSTISRVLISTSLGMVFASLIYFSLLSLFVFDTPNGTRFVKGHECTVEAKMIFGQSCPLLPKTMIKEANYDAEILWTQLSIMEVRLAILFSWLVIFICLSGFTGCFVVHHIRRHSRQINN